MERWSGHVALITGASKGIGAAIAQSLVRHGMKVYGCARDPDPILHAANELKDEPGKLFGIQCDLRDEAQILAMFERIKSKSGGVDVMINCCGLALPGVLLTVETEILRQMLDINVLALSICTREAVQSMLERNVIRGHVINFSSSSGQRVSSNDKLHFYSGTKFAVVALTEGLRAELQQKKAPVRVTMVSPGLTDTPGVDCFNTAEEKAALFGKMGGVVMQPSDVVEAVLYALAAPEHVQVHHVAVRPMWQ